MGTQNSLEIFRDNPWEFVDYWTEAQLDRYPESMVQGPPEVQQYCKSMLIASETGALLEDIINAFDAGIFPEYFLHIQQEAEILQRLRTRLLVKS